MGTKAKGKQILVMNTERDMKWLARVTKAGKRITFPLGSTDDENAPRGGPQEYDEIVKMLPFDITKIAPSPTVLIDVEEMRKYADNVVVADWIKTGKLRLASPSATGLL